MFEAIGGPDGLKAVLKQIGDDVTESELIELDLKDVSPGETRDTSAPEALAESMQAFTLGNVLTDEKRELLNDWLKRNTTGGDLIREGVSEDWVVDGKTGSGSYETRNDIAVIWPLMMNQSFIQYSPVVMKRMPEQPAHFAPEPARFHRHPARSAPEPARFQGQPARSAPEPARFQSHPAHLASEPARSQGQPARSAPDPARSQGQPARSTPEPARSQSQPARSAPEPARFQGQPARSASEPARSQGRLA
ncbi:serine hydrolase [Sporosarcina gallistercoris]|uniref:serine hydrolase n=1 Tax=Sporosarcina gallistercoris TaxID=2762245 RepID=UPI003D28A0A9